MVLKETQEHKALLVLKDKKVKLVDRVPKVPKVL